LFQVAHSNWSPDTVRVNVSPRWVETRTGDKVMLSILMKPEGSSSLMVEKSISLSREGVQVFVHNIPIKNNHVIWDDIDDSTGDGGGSEISMLASRVEDMKVCQGAGEKSCEELWTEGIFAKRGFVECGFQPSLVYRSHSCHLLVDYLVPICCACKGEQTNMTRMLRKRQRQSSKDRYISKINYRYIPAFEIAKALKEARTMNSKYKRTIFASGKIELLISKHGEKMSKGWSDEFININKENFEKMSPIQKLFWDQQLKAVSLAKKTSIRWHPMMIRLALHFAMVSPSAYENVRDSGFLVLPSKRTLYDYSHAVEAREGVQEEILKDVRHDVETKCETEDEKYFALITDEMDIRSNLVYHSKTGELVGYTKLTEVESEFENLKAQMNGSAEGRRPLAKKGFCLLVQKHHCQ